MTLREQLSGGDKRMNYMVRTVVNQAIANPGMFPGLVELIEDDDQLVRMRAADAVEKVTTKHPEWLEPYSDKLVGEWSEIDQQEVRWHVAMMLPRANLSHNQREQAIASLTEWVKPTTKSSIVRVFSLQALFDLKAASAAKVISGIMDDPKSPPSVYSRAKKLLNQLQ